MSSRLADSLELCYDLQNPLKEMRAGDGELETFSMASSTNCRQRSRGLLRTSERSSRRPPQITSRKPTGFGNKSPRWSIN